MSRAPSMQHDGFAAETRRRGRPDSFGGLRTALVFLSSIVLLLTLVASGAHAGGALPEIRTSATNVVPSCVTPERLMAFLRARNNDLDPRFDRIADWYKRHGEVWRVRWDYAFFQMALETNFLTYLRGDGRPGDVVPRQNNFAGLGTTGGGVPGDSYPDVDTGVLAQIQHLVAYSGEKLAHPVGLRTRLKQDDIITETRKLKRPARFSDLARRWAADRRYGASIEWIAERYRDLYCAGRENGVEQAAAEGGASGVAQPQARERLPWQARLVAPPQPASRPGQLSAAAGALPGRAARPAPEPQPASPPAPGSRAKSAASPTKSIGCSVIEASYGGNKTLLIRSGDGFEIRYTALTVLDGFERSMAESYVRMHAPGGVAIGTFESKQAAMARARELCTGT